MSTWHSAQLKEEHNKYYLSILLIASTRLKIRWGNTKNPLEGIKMPPMGSIVSYMSQRCFPLGLAGECSGFCNQLLHFCTNGRRGLDHGGVQAGLTWSQAFIHWCLCKTLYPLGPASVRTLENAPPSYDFHRALLA